MGASNQKAIEAAIALVGKWVRVRSDRPQKPGEMYMTPGRPFRVWSVGSVERDGRYRIFGPLECCWREDIETLTESEEKKAQEEWERNV